MGRGDTTPGEDLSPDELLVRLLTEGRILRPGAWEMCTLFDVNYIPKQMTVAQLEAGLLALGKELYSEEATASRRAGFREQWRRGMRTRRLDTRRVAS